ncbi:MAG: DNA mismatch repair endonuclease MutL, partial [Chloroflexi bacterium]|nr:DNA mismatch repair endonuclease MutL [Chloroflexota bacterium]
MPIRQLPDKVSSMIAAGEVIERPASVVKELVENALDAGASEISVEAHGGGVEQIRVADNGHGIPHDEVELAFQRFATSKLTDASDLDAIPTLGFRGEALPSIASVARVSVVTRHANEESGTRLDLDEGRVVDKQRQGASTGTVMTVRQLFRNVPARRKFLRAATTEASHIQNLVTRYALAYPEVRFALKSNGRSLQTPGSGSLREAVAAINGLNVAEAMLDIESADGELQAHSLCAVSGMVSQPNLNRANRGYMSFFVNRRWVQSRMLGYALERAYHGFLMERRYPMAVVNIVLDYDMVDVNVHPSKTEVRFRNGDRVFSAIQRAVRGTLAIHSPVPEIRRVGQSYPPASYPYPAEQSRSNRHFWPIEPFERAPDGIERRDDGVAPPDVSVNETDSALTPRQALPVLRVLGQVQSTYIVAEGPDGLYLIDQHAAHERVMYERIKADAAASEPQSQSLMEPLTVELDPKQQELAQTHMQL